MATAEMVLASIRDIIPDPTYGSTGQPQVLSDGQLMRQQALVRWLNHAMTIVSRETKCLKDWTAIPSRLNQDFYDVDPRFFHVLEAYYDGWPLVKSTQADYFYRGVLGGPAFLWAMHGRGVRLRLALWPFGLRTPGDTFLQNALGPNDNTTIAAISLANFGTGSGGGLGWVRIGNQELCTYRTINASAVPPILGVISRGQGGTPAVSHASGARLQECNVWIMGYRTATPVALPLTSGSATLSDPGYTPGTYTLGLTDQLEIPDHLVPILEPYVLSRVRHAEQEFQEGQALEKTFYGLVKDAAADVRLATMPTGMQVRTSPAGRWYGRRIIT